MRCRALLCPDCGKETVFNGRGRCTCGTYLIRAWQGMNRGASLPLPRGRVLGWNERDASWQVLREKEPLANDGDVFDGLMP